MGVCRAQEESEDARSSGEDDDEDEEAVDEPCSRVRGIRGSVSLSSDESGAQQASPALLSDTKHRARPVPILPYPHVSLLVRLRAIR